MARRSPSDPLRRAALLAVAAGLTAAVAAAGARLAQRRTAKGTGIDVQDTYRCGCGSEYRVSGIDRHRVFWPAGAPESEPVLGDRCPDCEAPLPTGHGSLVT